MRHALAVKDLYHLVLLDFSVAQLLHLFKWLQITLLEIEPVRRLGVDTYVEEDAIFSHHRSLLLAVIISVKHVVQLSFGLDAQLHYLISEEQFVAGVQHTLHVFIVLGYGHPHLLFLANWQVDSHFASHVFCAI